MAAQALSGLSFLMVGYEGLQCLKENKQVDQVKGAFGTLLYRACDSFSQYEESPPSNDCFRLSADEI